MVYFFIPLVLSFHEQQFLILMKFINVLYNRCSVFKKIFAYSSIIKTFCFILATTVLHSTFESSVYICIQCVVKVKAHFFHMDNKLTQHYLLKRLFSPNDLLWCLFALNKVTKYVWGLFLGSLFCSITSFIFAPITCCLYCCNFQIRLLKLLGF